MLDYGLWLVAMGLLLVCSAFFSSSEAALFLLGSQDRRQFASGNRAQRAAARLLRDPDRLLTAVLFWNLVVNITYFAIAAITSLRLERAGRTDYAGLFALGALLSIIFFSELLPKSLAVLQPRRLAAWLSLPLATTVHSSLWASLTSGMSKVIRNAPIPVISNPLR